MWLLLLACAEPEPAGLPVPDSESDSAPPSDSDTPVVPPDVCDTLSLTRSAWADGDNTGLLNSVASDFSVELIDGSTWTLSENWTGCENLLVLPSEPKQNQGFSEDVWASKRDFSAFFDLLPANTRLLFVGEAANADREEMLAELVDKVGDALSDEQESWWYEGRFLVAKDRPGGLDNWLGDALSQPGWGIGIDRFQRIRYTGSYGDPARYDSGVGWFAPNIEMVANEAVYYNFEAEREAWVAKLDGQVLTVLDGVLVQDGSWAGVTTDALVELPDLSGYDSLFLDLLSECQGDGEYGDCPAWDYISWLQVCEPDGTGCVELGRWITTYHREGRWVHDVSPLLPLLGDGGRTKLFRYYSQQPYETTLKLRFADQGHADRPEALEHLFNGGYLGTDYNLREPVSVEIPADVSRVELVTVLTGHGMDSVGNCAEFCEILHVFGIDGHDVEITFPIDDPERGCMSQVASGTVPNQYGTWWYGRNGWCPGREVGVQRRDVTGYAVPGATVEVSYDATYRGADFTGGSANIVAESWLVYYR